MSHRSARQSFSRVASETFWIWFSIRLSVAFETPKRRANWFWDISPRNCAIPCDKRRDKNPFCRFMGDGLCLTFLYTWVEFYACVEKADACRS